MAAASGNDNSSGRKPQSSLSLSHLVEGRRERTRLLASAGRRQKRDKNRFLPSSLELLEERVVLSAPAPLSESIASTPNQGQFGNPASLSASAFLGPTFNNSLSIGGIANTPIGSFGAQLSAAISGKIGLQLNGSVTGGTVTTNIDSVLHQDYAEPTQFNQLVDFSPDNTYLDYTSGALATTTPAISSSADLVFQMNGSLGGQICVFGCGGGSLGFGANVDVPIYSFDSSTGNLSVIGVPLSNEIVQGIGNTIFNALANDALSIPIAGPVSVQASLNAAPSELDASLDVGINLTDIGDLKETDAHPGETTMAQSNALTNFLKNIPQATFNLATAALRIPQISLNSDGVNSDGTVTDTETDPVAEMDIQAGALAGMLGLPPIFLTTSQISLGSIASLNFTPLSFQLSPTLDLVQTGTAGVVNTLTYQFSRPVDVFKNGIDQGMVSQVQFQPGKDTLGVKFDGQSPITVTPTLEQQLQLYNQIDLDDDLNATLTVGELSGNISGLGSFQLGPVYQQSFNFARATLATIAQNSFQLADQTTSLPQFTIGDTFHPNLSVTNTSDTAASGSLRFAVDSANLLASQGMAGPLTITLGPGTYTLSQQAMGDLVVTAPDVNIVGAGAGQTIIDASGLGSRAFDVMNHAGLHLSGVTIQGGSNVGDGGAIIAESGSTVSIADSVLQNNSALLYGGAVEAAPSSTLTITDSTLSGNSVVAHAPGPNYQAAGGAIDSSGTVTVASSTFSSNSVTGASYFADGLEGEGGAVAIEGGQFTADNSTFALNTATGGVSTYMTEGGGGVGGNGVGGAFFVNAGTVVLVNDTVASNQAVLGTSPYPSHDGDGYGGGIYVAGGTVSPGNTLIANDTASTSGNDVSGTLSSLGHNLIGSSAGGSGYDPTDLLNQTVSLGPLQNNGGRTSTMVPTGRNLPAVNAGSDTVAASLGTDQRGYPRHAGQHVDIGAVEFQYDLSLSGGQTVKTAAGTITYNFIESNNGPDTIRGYGFADTLPTGETIQSATFTTSIGGSGTFGTPGSNQASFGQVGVLPPGQSVSFTITASLPAGQAVSNTASVSTTNNLADTNPLNDTATLVYLPTQEGQTFAANTVLFHFNDPRPGATATDYTASVSWGDGASNNSADGTGTISVIADPAGGFDVVGTHAYTSAATFNPRVIVTGLNGEGTAEGSAPAQLYLAEGNTVDSAGAAPGVISGNVSFVPGEVGQGFFFNGGDSKVVLAPAEIGQSDFSLDLGIQTQAGDRATLIGNRLTVSHGNWVSIRLAAGRIVAEVDQDNLGTNYVLVESNKLVNDGQFHQVAIVRQGPSLAIYIDGSLDSVTSGAGVADITNPAPLIAGFEPADDAGLDLDSYTGTLDEIALYDRAQTASEILGMYTAVSQGMLPGGSAEAVVADAPLSSGPITVPPITQAQPLNNVVLLHFTDANPLARVTDFDAGVVWGDLSSNRITDGSGKVAIVPDTAGGFDVVGTHTYSIDGPATLGVVVIDQSGAAPLSLITPINVMNADLSVAGTTITPIAGDPAPPVVSVATFTDPAGTGNPADYNATIDWGDGALSQGTIVRVGQTNTFVVEGQHAYATPGIYKITVPITADAPTPFTAESTANVLDSIVGVPASSPEGTAVFINAGSDTGVSNAQVDSQHLFQVQDFGGGTTLVGQNLTFNGSNSIPLPSGFIQGATILTVDLTFETTKGGVLLGYQNQPVGNVPTNFVPALYVGSNGKLDAELYVGGGPAPIVSNVAVNDGLTHHAVLTLSGNTQTLTLDGQVVGSISGMFLPLDMSFSQLGTGFTMTWPGITSGYSGFVGTIDQVSISTSSTLTASTISGPRYRDLWQVTSASGSTDIVGRDLTFTGASDAIALPNGLINGAANLTVDVTFRTTQGGVILGYQNQPLGDAPGNFVPALYVGSDGHLYAEIYDGTYPIRSTATVNDGLEHHAELTLTGGNLQILTLDGTQVGTLSGTVQPLDMKFDQLGWGVDSTWPAGSGGFDPFVGVLDQVSITTSPTLSSSVVVDQSFTNPQDGVRYLYQVNSPSGATAIVGRALTFTGSDSIPLPSGLVHNATNLSIDVTFRTTSQGVILGYQNQPAGTAPTNYVPALYVGSDGHLYGELFAGFGNAPVRSSVAVNDGLSHHAVLSISGTTQTLVLDGQTVGSISGSLVPLDMIFNQLGTGYTGGVWPGGTAGYDPFVGTIDQVSISSDPTLAAALVQPGQWQVSAQSGQTQLSAQGLQFTGTNAIPLPDGLVHDATSLVFDVTFHTTQEGVILGYQNQPITAIAPGSWVPALFVGSDGLLYGELFDDQVNPIHSTAAVNDGVPHHAVLSLNGTTLSLSLDGVLLGQVTGMFDPKDMTFDQLGTGYTSSWPGGNGGYDNFVGTLDQVVITTNGKLDPLAAVGGSVAGQLRFTPPGQGAYVVTQYSTGPDGRTAATSQTINSTAVPITLSAGGNTVVVQGGSLSRIGSFTAAPGDGPWTATVNYGDGTGAQALSVASGQTFMLSHSYPNAGLFNVVVTVRNAAGNTAQGGFQISVSGFTVNDGSPQHSMVRSLTYTFTNPTQVELGAFKLLKNGKPSNINLKIAPQPDGMTYLITFTGPGVIGGSVPDGNYTLITLHDKVKVPSGPPMTQDDVNNFVRLFGDADGDGVVNAADKALLHQAEANPASPYTADFEYDGKNMIDKTDIAQFNRRYKSPMAPPKKAPAKFPGRKVTHHVAPHHASATPRPAGAHHSRPALPQHHRRQG